jgi:hypothetical protein
MPEIAPIAINRTAIEEGELRYLSELLTTLPELPYSDDDWRTLVCSATGWALNMTIDGAPHIRTPHRDSGDAAVAALLRHHTPEEVIELGLPKVFEACGLRPEHQGGVRRMTMVRLVRADVHLAGLRFLSFVRSVARPARMPAAEWLLNDLVYNGSLEPQPETVAAVHTAATARTLAEEFETRKREIGFPDRLRGMVAIMGAVARIAETYGDERREAQRRFVAATKMLAASREIACGDCAEAIVSKGVTARCEDDTPFVPVIRAIVVTDPMGKVATVDHATAQWNADGSVSIEGWVEREGMTGLRLFAEIEECIEGESRRPEGFEVRCGTHAGTWSVVFGAEVKP